MNRILLLGGTTEASTLAQALAAAGMDAVFSYAGRTGNPIAQPLPSRIGGFGGVEGLADYLRHERITHLIDATHPFAAAMSHNAIAAAVRTGVPLCAFERAPWVAGDGDDWRIVPDIQGAVEALPTEPSRIFLAIGKQTLAPFAARSQHHYLLRLVDPQDGPLPLASADAVIARGPFTKANDLALLREHRITHIVAKNAGGVGAEAKLKAARILRIPVILIARPALPEREVLDNVDAVMSWIKAHPARLGL